MTTEMTPVAARNTLDRPSGFTIGIGDDEMRMYTWVAYPIICMIINIFGIVTNIVNIVCFAKQGFKDPVNISLLGLSVSDLASITTLCLTLILVPVGLTSVDLPFESLDITYMMSSTPHFAFTRVSSCITAMITFERCLSIMIPLKIKGIVTPERTAVIVIAIFVTFTFSVAPVYFANKLGIYFSLRRNRTTYGIVFRDPREQIERLTLLINNFIVPFGAFIIIGVCTIILSAQLRLKSKWRKQNVSTEQGDKVSSRNQKVAKMVVLMSVLYIACFVPSCVVLLAMAFEPALFIKGKYINITIVLCGIMYLEGINSSMNIFIYHHMSSKYRETFNKLFGLKTNKKVLNR